MATERADRYWRETFGVSDAEFGAPGILVRANSGRVSGRSAAWVFVCGDSCLVSVPPDLLGFVREAAQDLPPEAVLSPEVLHALFRGRITRTVGPSYQGYAERLDFRPLPCEQIRLLSGADRPALERLRGACDPAEWEDSGVSLDSEPLFGYVNQGSVLAVAGVILWSPYAANPAVLTHPGSRGQGCGTAVASAAMAHILDQGSVVLYQTLLQNRAAVRIAASLGCQEYARMMYAGLGSDEGQPRAQRDAEGRAR